MTAPRATYRLQLGPGFGFREAGEVAGYLAALGISHMYCSPLSQAAPGSEHGYDVADPTRVSDDLGGPLAYAAMIERLRHHRLGLVLDIVPNHMSVATPLNRWWWDVLRFGRASPHARYFDIDWEAPHADGRVMLPILGDHLREAIAREELRLERGGSELRLSYFDHTVPLAPVTVARILRDAGDAFAPLAEQHERLAAADRVDLESRDTADAALEAALADPRRAVAIDAALGRAEKADHLPMLLDEQAWRLTFWRDDTSGRNYRRFFEIDQLVGVRVEDEEVFEATHALALAAIGSGDADGLRIDHPDGLRDPAGYVQRLRQRAPEAWLVLEKILEHGEAARENWPIDGLTGYDFLSTITGVLTDPAGAAPLQEAWSAFAGEAPDWDELVYTCKRFAADTMLAPEIDRVCRTLAAGGDMAPEAGARFGEAVVEVACALSVYRTYLRPGLAPAEAPDHEDMELVLDACALAKERREDLAAEIDRVQAAMLGDSAAAPDELAFDRDAAAFTLRFQQVSGVLMAKGVEDTAAYRHLRLVALNEVGGDPSQFGLDLEEFHDGMHDRRAKWPRGMLASSTHDTKRSEDVRARLFVLAEIPGVWRAATERWRQAAAPLRREAGPPGINAHDEYLLYQTLVGAWPIEEQRTSAYMRKAIREAKLRSNWTDPDAACEQAMERFIASLYRGGEPLAGIAAFAGRITPHGRINALSQTLLKLTCPGVPDVYQGCELWDHSLVDPDNRRPVDFGSRQRLLDELADLDPADIWQRMDDGLPKLWLIRQALHLRARRPELIDGSAAYVALGAVGERKECCIAFMRDEGLIAIATRFPARLESAGGWGDTALELPAGEWVDALTGSHWPQGNHHLGALLHSAPVALLERQ